ncbi:MAG: protein kinase [Anaerolineales bacterium]
MDTKPLSNGTILKNRYQVLRLIAGGGMAWVYQVQEQRPDGTGVLWALKELRLDVDDAGTLAEARRLFEQEANILVRLSHPTLPQVAAFFTENGRSYLVMEFIHGTSLQKRLDAACGPLLQAEVLPYAIQVCDVLSYLHAQPSPVIFRDLKPSNIMVTPAGQVKLIDFGIARTFKQGQAHDTVSMGSENYAAPEQWGRAQSDGRADIYGLGATLYHLLAGVPPLPAFVPGPQPSLSSQNPAVSPELVRVIETAMQPDRERRYPTAAHLRQALLECLPLFERLRYRGAAPAGRVEASAPIAPAAATAVADRQYCPVCGGSNLSHARFCRHCGQPLAAAVAIEPASAMAAEPAASLSASLSAELVVVEPAGSGWRIALAQPRLLLGRPHGQRPIDVDFSALDPNAYVSRNHALIEVVPGGHTLTDLGSANGTLVNGVRLQPQRPVLLRDGDRIVMGKLGLQYRIRKGGR